MNCKKTLSKIRERNFMDTLAADAGSLLKIVYTYP